MPLLAIYSITFMELSCFARILVTSDRSAPGGDFGRLCEDKRRWFKPVKTTSVGRRVQRQIPSG